VASWASNVVVEVFVVVLAARVRVVVAVELDITFKVVVIVASETFVVVIVATAYELIEYTFRCFEPPQSWVASPPQGNVQPDSAPLTAPAFRDVLQKHCLHLMSTSALNHFIILRYIRYKHT
jgi:hypothetical protein